MLIFEVILSVSAVFSCVQTMVWLQICFFVVVVVVCIVFVFNVCTDADTCDCTRGLYWTES